MSNLQALSDAQVSLLAAQFISDVNVESLQVLAAERKDVLTRDLIYRLLLTFYPSNETARSALLALLRTIRTDVSNISNLNSQIDVSSVAKLAPEVATSLAKQLHLSTIKNEDQKDDNDALADFVIAWAHHVESADGELEDLLPLVEECMSESPSLERWATTYLLPIIRLRYHFYPGEEISIRLQQLETTSGLSSVKVLLECAQKHSTHAQIGRDLDEVVSPWIEGAGTIGQLVQASWADVYEWILDTSLTDFQLAAKALLEWDGPPSVRGQASASSSEDLSSFAQTALAVIYANSTSSEDVLQLSRRILDRVGALIGMKLPDISIPDPEIIEPSSLVADISDANLLHNALLSQENKLTRASQSSTVFLAGVLKTADILMQYKLQLTVADITRICLSTSEERQNQELRRILQQFPRLTSTELEWSSIRQQMLWLRSWRQPSEDLDHNSSLGPFLGHLAKQHVEASLLDSMLSMGHYVAAKQIYVESGVPPLNTRAVEDQVVSAVYLAYDNASNGNRNRGGVKRASDILAAFRSSFTESQNFRNIDHLLKATHSLSFYQLTLQHGVPLRPVNIRAHNDPLDLVGRVLEQNSKAYTKLDDLLEIGRNLVLARLHDKDSTWHESGQSHTRLLEAERRVTYLAITSALAAHDFETAYSYITTRLSTTPETKPSGDDYSWRAAYFAGRYRPANPPKLLHDRIGGLSKRMDLLSLSLTLAPHAESLSEILGQWRRCEEEMDTLKSQALEEERAFEAQSDETMPGGFGVQDQERDAAETKQAMAKRYLGGSAASYDDEAPMGLFDVARGAATALRRSAFPLNAGAVKDFKIRDGHSRQASDGSAPRSPVTEDGSGRVRKRDMVSNMVTSGFVSGMGWVLGTQPVNKPDGERD